MLGGDAIVSLHALRLPHNYRPAFDPRLLPSDALALNTLRPDPLDPLPLDPRLLPSDALALDALRTDALDTLPLDPRSALHDPLAHLWLRTLDANALLALRTLDANALFSLRTSLSASGALLAAIGLRFLGLGFPRLSFLGAFSGLVPVALGLGRSRNGKRGDGSDQNGPVH